MEPQKISITPDTKISALLEQYPDLEQVLIDMAPAFKKLKNPVLRKTVARVATLRQVAQIGDVGLGVLINRLRQTAGIDSEFITSDKTDKYSAKPPIWFNSKRIAKSLDARPILEAGEQPLSVVMNDLRALSPGDIYELITPFLPAPIIDKAKEKNFNAWTKQEEPELFITYLFNKGDVQ